MAVKYALHEIHHARNGVAVVQAPGEVFEVDDADVAFFEKVGAIRDPDDRELTCYKAATGQLVAAPATAPEPTPAPSKSGPSKAGADEDAIG